MDIQNAELEDTHAHEYLELSSFNQAYREIRGLKPWLVSFGSAASLGQPLRPCVVPTVQHAKSTLKSNE